MVAHVDLTQLSPLTELILRAGDVRDPKARLALQANYIGLNPAYPGVVGVSVAFRAGASLDELAQANRYPHGMISWNVLLRVQQELAHAGFGMVLLMTPDPPLFPDHHSLAVTRGNQIQPTLSDQAADALIQAFSANVVKNPHQVKKPKP